MADFRKYDPGLVVFTFGEVQALGFMDGTFITAEREEESFSKHVGSQGDVTRVRNRNRSGRVTVTLVQSSPTNDLLSQILANDELFGNGERPLMVKDLNGTTLIDAPIAWIAGPPSVEYGDEVAGREWNFDCAEMLPLVGGSSA